MSHGGLVSVGMRVAGGSNGYSSVGYGNRCMSDDWGSVKHWCSMDNWSGLNDGVGGDDWGGVNDGKGLDDRCTVGVLVAGGHWVSHSYRGSVDHCWGHCDVSGCTVDAGDQAGEDYEGFHGD